MDSFALLAQPARARAFDPSRAVNHEQQDKLIRAAEQAPSSSGRRSWHLVVVRTQEGRQRLAACCDEARRVADAVVCLVFCAGTRSAAGDRGHDHDRLARLDAAAAATHARLAATALELASDWVACLDPSAVARTLDLQPHLQSVVILAVGYER